MAVPEVPDWTRPIQLFASGPTGELIPVLVDADGQLYIVIQGELVGITGDVNVTQTEKDREIQGKDGTTKRTVAVDGSGHIIMVPYGTLTVDGAVDVTQVDSTRTIQGADGVTLHTIAVDAAGRIIMVPYGVTAVSGDVDVTQVSNIREVQGADGVTLRTLVVDSAGRLIMVPRGQSGYYMAVDASGYLTTVLKGIEGSTLRTVVVDASGNIVAAVKGMYDTTPKDVAVDASGRMIMIPTDPADVWGNAISMGNAELAVRLTGLGGYDRRGQVIFIDSFKEGPGKGVLTTSGTGGTTGLDTTWCRTGGISLRLTAGSDSSRYAAITYYPQYPISGKVGVEIAFAFAKDTEYIALILTLWDGTTKHIASIRYNQDNSKIQYLDSGEAWQNLISNVILTENPPSFHSMKMVVDLIADQYTRVLIDGWSWLTGGLGIYTIADAAAKTFWEQVFHYGAAGKNPAAYIDHIIITQNEPA